MYYSQFIYGAFEYRFTARSSILQFSSHTDMEYILVQSRVFHESSHKGPTDEKKDFSCCLRGHHEAVPKYDLESFNNLKMQT